MGKKSGAKRPPKTSLLVAVDGPAASGKGTIARAVARHYGLPHMDTGLLYRAVALNLWRWGGDPGNEFEALRACDMMGIDPADEELRSEPVARIVSAIAAATRRRRRITRPVTPKPSIIIAQVPGSGTPPATSITKLSARVTGGSPKEFP